MSHSVVAYQLRLHLIVLIFGFTGILGKLIDLPSSIIVVYRMVIAMTALWLFLKWNKISFTNLGKNRYKWLLTGLIVGTHWFCFFESIKLSTVSVALVSLSSTSLFTAILEPLFRKKKFEVYEVVFSILIIVGMTLILSFEFKYALGIFFGVLCAFLASLFTVLNGGYVVNQRSDVISLYELAGGALFMTVLVLAIDMPSFAQLPSLSDLIYLLLLGIVATAFAFVVSIQVMKQLSAFTVSLTINLEPLYGIILALFIFGEEEYMSTGFYIGFAIILSTILINAYIKKQRRKIKVV